MTRGTASFSWWGGKSTQASQESVVAAEKESNLPFEELLWAMKDGEVWAFREKWRKGRAVGGLAGPLP